MEGSLFTLFRNGKLLREIPCEAGWDWDIGYATLRFGDEVKFEYGMDYTVVLPAGSVHARLRDDLVNEEIVFNFKGGEENISPVHFVRFSDNLLERPESLGEVTFTYDREVELTPDPRVLLYRNDEETYFAEAVPNVECVYKKPARRWEMTVDFGNIALNPEDSYRIVIPEGTLCGKDMVANAREVIPVGVPSGISAVSGNAPSVTTESGCIRIDGLTEPARIIVYGIDGTQAAFIDTAESSVSVPVPTAGTYILSPNGAPHKVIVR